MGRWLTREQREERRLRILELRRQGLTYRQIMQRLGIGIAAIITAVKEAKQVKRK